MTWAIEIHTTDGDYEALRTPDGEVRLYDDFRRAHADAYALPGCRIDPQAIESIVIAEFCPVRWYGQEEYSREEAAKVCWEVADRTGDAYALLGNRYVGVWSIVAAEQLKQDDEWLKAWEVEAIRDPAVWLKHRPVFRSHWFAS